MPIRFNLQYRTEECEAKEDNQTNQNENNTPVTKKDKKDKKPKLTRKEQIALKEAEKLKQEAQAEQVME